MRHPHIVALMVVAAAAPLWGFSSASSFDLEAEFGGGGGYTFTGSPVSHTMDCATCHQGGVGTVDVSVTSLPAGLFGEGYEPGVVYQVDVHLLAESRGLDRNHACEHGLAGCNRNLFVAEMLTEQGAPLGVLCPDEDPMSSGDSCDSVSGKLTTLLADGHAISGQSLAAPELCSMPAADPSACLDIEGMAQAGMSQDEIAAAVNAEVEGSTSWSFLWRAPVDDEQTAHLHLGLVDGDGQTLLDDSYADYAGDGVAIVHAAIAARGASATPAVAGSGCGGSSGGWTPWFAFLAMLVGPLRETWRHA